MTDKSTIRRIHALDRERTTLFEQTLQRANQAVEDLNAFGLKYRLVTGTAAAGTEKKR